jgi:uncharacterized protein (DUF924 family)
MSQAGAPAFDEVLTFWFGAPGSPQRDRAMWWNRDPELDCRIRERFGSLHARVLGGECEGWCATPRGWLAYVVMLDQFSRHIYRDAAGAFAGDGRALAAARLGRDREWDRALSPVERQFVYMPFQHSEELGDQDLSVKLFEELARAAPEVDQRRWAFAHREIIRAHGRFPHRDAALGRVGRSRAGGEPAL